MTSVHHLDNPAGRLLVVMSALRKAPADRQIDLAVRLALDLPDEGPRDELYKGMVELEQAAQDAETQLRALPDLNEGLMLRWVDPINDTLAWCGRHAHTINNVHGLLNEVVLFSLEVCADRLHKDAPQPYLDADNLETLLATVRDAVDQVATFDGVPAEMRLDMLAKLREVEDAILRARIGGYGAVSTAVATVVGTVVQQPAMHTSKVWAMLTKLVSALHLSTQGVKAVTDGAESIQRLHALTTGS